MTGVRRLYGSVVAAGCAALMAAGCTGPSVAPVLSTPPPVSRASVATDAREVCARDADAAAEAIRGGQAGALLSQLGVGTKIEQVVTRLNQVYAYTRISESAAVAEQRTRAAAPSVCDTNGDPALTTAQLVALRKLARPTTP